MQVVGNLPFYSVAARDAKTMDSRKNPLISAWFNFSTSGNRTYSFLTGEFSKYLMGSAIPAANSSLQRSCGNLKAIPFGVNDAHIRLSTNNAAPLKKCLHVRLYPSRSGPSTNAINRLRYGWAIRIPRFECWGSSYAVCARVDPSFLHHQNSYLSGQALTYRRCRTY